METQIELNGNKPCYICINTSECEEWSGNKNPLITPMYTIQEMEDTGFHKDDINRIQSLVVGQIIEDFDFEGVYVMRLA